MTIVLAMILACQSTPGETVRLLSEAIEKKDLPAIKSLAVDREEVDGLTQDALDEWLADADKEAHGHLSAALAAYPLFGAVSKEIDKLERVLVVMEERDMFPELSSGVEILVCGFPDVPRVELVRVAELLRRRGHRVDLHPDPTRKLGMQLRYANEVGAREAAIVGMAEVEKGVVKIKDLTSGDQREEPLEEVGVSPPE